MGGHTEILAIGGARTESPAAALLPPTAYPLVAVQLAWAGEASARASIDMLIAEPGRALLRGPFGPDNAMDGLHINAEPVLGLTTLC